MAQSRPSPRSKDLLKVKNSKEEIGDHCISPEPDNLGDNSTLDTDSESVTSAGSKTVNKPRVSPNTRSNNKTKSDTQSLPDVGKTGTSPTTHSNMKTKQVKEDLDKSNDEDTTVEPKTRSRKKVSDTNDDEKIKPSEEPKTSKETKKITKSKTLLKKRPLGIRKTRSKKPIVATNKLKNVIRQKVKRGRKPVLKTETVNPQEETIPLIPASEIKTEPLDDTTPNSRSSSPRTAGRRQRLSSDMVMMKSLLADTPSSLVVGPRTSPYSMRSERSNSPSLFEGKNLRSGKPRKVKNNLLNEVVMKEQKKRRRLLSDSKAPEADGEDCKKLKRGRSCSRDGSEISKCSDITESDVSLSETINDVDNKELNKKIENSKTDLDIDIENNVQISTIEKVPSQIDPKISENKPDTQPSSVNEKTKKKLSLKRSTFLDSDNNNSNRLKLENLNSSDIEDKLMVKTENESLFIEARSSILTSMSKTFNSKEVSKNIRKARRGRKAAAAAKPCSTPVAKNGLSSTVTNDINDDKHETLETLSKEIDDLINNLDQNIDKDHETVNDAPVEENSCSQLVTKPVSKFYSLSKPLGDNNSIVAPDTPVKDKETNSTQMANEMTPSKNDDSENIRLHYEDSAEKSSDTTRHEITYKCNTVASIDKLMDRLKEFEEFDKRRQRQESESKTNESKSVMVTSDVVLIPKSGADIKPLKDIQSVRSPERPIEKENVLSCFENNSAISIVKREQVRKSVDLDLPNSITLIKRNSVSARKESTSSNHSRESDAISIFEKSLGKDVTLTEIRKSVDKSSPATPVELLPFATLHPNNPNHSLAGMIDSNQISITPRVIGDKGSELLKRKSRESLSRKSSESVNDDDKMAIIEKIKSPPHQVKTPAITITPTPVAVKSPEVVQPMETEALAPPLDNVKEPTDIPLTTEISKVESVKIESPEVPNTETKDIIEQTEQIDTTTIQKETSQTATESVDKVVEDEKVDAKMPTAVEKSEPSAVSTAEIDIRPAKSKSTRHSTESQPGPSSVLLETPENQKRKENVLRTLGLLTHKAAKEAKIEKLKEKERIYERNLLTTKNKTVKSATGDYTGTLKAVIKRTGDKKKYRSSLKMTFQKSKNRTGKPSPEVGETTTEDFYTIERREGGAVAASDDTETVPEPVEAKETLNLVIPEKASSFSIHPGRLCMDQCFYCGGKFGLFDTPCHIAQIKSSDRQKKILDNEEKLTIDSCLCDACYRHVDRRANCPSYRKRPLVKPPDAPLLTSPPLASLAQPENDPPAGLEEESGEESMAGGKGSAAGGAAGGRPATCHTDGCALLADHSIRRKWLIKMRGSVNKLLKLKCDYPGLHTIPLCGEHYRALAPLMACVLCRTRITKHQNVHFVHSYLELNPLLASVGVPVQFTERPVLCKVCRYYCTLLQRREHREPMAKAHTRKLLQKYNVEIPEDLLNETEDASIIDYCNSSMNKHKKKARTKSKQRKSSEPDKQEDSLSSERTTESSPEKDKVKEESESTEPIEEDIESLISSNKIPVPGATKPNEQNPQSDGSENEGNYEIEAPLIPLDKQTELQYLLQKQNNPAQFLQKTNLTQKQKNVFKLQSISAIHKPGHQHRINEKNAKRIQKLGQILAHKDKIMRRDDEDIDRSREGIAILKSLNEECTIETIPNKRPADINTLKNKWQMSESFTQVKKNLSELSKKIDKEPKKLMDLKYSNPVKRLETNPSISVRELFPGEEEMNLQCNIEFNNVKGVTPEGWEKCNTMIQYDVETKKLWNELQRPYGNQSSFLRHLILLEKYFRNGDLILSQTATPHAITYSDSVQSRLRAYDNVASEAPRRSEPSISLIEFRKKPSINGKSLLKTNQDNDSKKCMPPPGTVPKAKSKDKVKSKQLPPELIAINTPNAQGRKAIQNVLHNIQQLVKGVSASDPTEIAAAPLPLPKFESPKIDPKPDPPKFDTPMKEKKDNPKETPKKQKPTSKPWRPTLMPITQENLAKIAREPTQVAVDGRLLPSLVQVMSSGTRYHITIQDYNKMCIMRREKLQQIKEGEKKRPSLEETTVVTELQPSTMLGNGGTVVQNITMDTDKKEMPELSQISSNAANILKNVGLKNITIAPIPAKTATVTSQTLPMPVVTSPSLLVSTNPLKIPQLGPAVSITSEPVLNNLPIMSASHVVMPKIPKSLTVIPQTVMASVPQNVVVTQSQLVPSGDGQRP